MDVERGRIKKAAGPDQGFAWFIAFICFLINFLLLGMSRSLSVLYSALIDLYGVNRATATLPFTTRVCVRNLTGPFIGVLGQKYGIRKIAAIGGFVAALGSILCAFAPNITCIIVFWGVVHGLGYGLCTALHMMIINHYFVKYRASAFGLSYTGDCFGTFVFPIVIETLLAQYGVSGTFLILGGIMLNAIPLTIFLKLPPWSTSDKKTAIASTSGASKNDAIAEDEYNESKQIKFEGHTNKAFLGTEEDAANAEDDTSLTKSQLFSISEMEDSPDLRKLVMTKCGMDILNRKHSPDSSPRLQKQRSHQNARHHSLPPAIEEEVMANQTLNVTDHIINSPSNQRRRHTEMIETKQKVETNLKPRRRSSFSQMARGIAHTMRNASLGSLGASDGFLINVYQETEEEKKIIKSPRNQTRRHTEAPYSQRRVNLDAQPRRMSSFSQMARKIGHTVRSASSASQMASDGFIANIGQGFGAEYDRKSSSEPSRNSSMPSSITDSDLSTIEEDEQYDGTDQEPEKQPSIFKLLLRTNIKPMFLLISSTMAAYGFLFIGLLTIIVDYASDMNISHENGKLLIIGFSATDLVGRLSFGVVIDKKLLKLKNYAFMTMFLMGILVVAIPLHENFYYIMTCMCLYGFIQGGTAIMFPILIGSYLERSEYSVAMGCLNFYGGILVLALAPMIGYFRDNTGSYRFIFFIIGGISAFLGLLWQLEPCIIACQNRKLEKKQLSESLSTKL